MSNDKTQPILIAVNRSTGEWIQLRPPKELDRGTQLFDALLPVLIGQNPSIPLDDILQKTSRLVDAALHHTEKGVPQ